MSYHAISYQIISYHMISYYFLAQEARADLIAQVQNLTKQLLKKQGDVLELQAERAALKSRQQDLLAR